MPMPVPIDILPSELAQLLFVSALVAFSVLVGQSLFEYAHRIDRRIKSKITDREHPDIKYVLYDILWAPFVLLAVFILMRTGILFLPSGDVAATLATLLDTVLIATLVWFAIRIIKEVVLLADKDTITGSTEA